MRKNVLTTALALALISVYTMQARAQCVAVQTELAGNCVIQVGNFAPNSTVTIFNKCRYGSW